MDAMRKNEMPVPNADPVSLAGWVARLGESGMPVFAHTAQDIARVSASRESSAAELARVILQDAAMTARLLKVANSPIFNPAGRAISTVSRAVVVLGFEEVRSICLSIAVVESMLKGKQKQRVIETMARSFHAAVQARSLARRRGDKSPEEVFIATLLYRLGDMAFWAFAGESAAQMDTALMQHPAERPERLQKQLLGFMFRDLTLGLSQEWKLGALLDESLQGKAADNPRAGNVVLGHELALAAESGWESHDVKVLISRIAENLYLPEQEVVRMVQESAQEAADTAAFYGADSASRLIPVAGDRECRQDSDSEAALLSEFPQPDSLLQLSILREISTLMQGKPDFSMVLEMVLEGMFRGIGLDRTLFALCSPDHRCLTGRYALGTGNEKLSSLFRFETGSQQANIFSYVIATRRTLWVGRENQPDIDRLVTEPVRAITRGADFFVTPIEINGKVIGVFYADRQPSGRLLDEESFASFGHFSQQGNQVLICLNAG